MLYKRIIVKLCVSMSSKNTIELITNWTRIKIKYRFMVSEYFTYIIYTDNAEKNEKY